MSQMVHLIGGAEIASRFVFGKLGKHSFGCAGALGGEGEQKVRVITLRVVVTEAVERNEDNLVF